MYNLRVGDILVCKCNTYANYFIELSIGKAYEIRTINLPIGRIPINITEEYLEFEIFDDMGELHGFSFSVYNLWFYTNQELRKIKLERLNQC